MKSAETHVAPPLPDAQETLGWAMQLLALQTSNVTLLFILITVMDCKEIASRTLLQQAHGSSTAELSLSIAAQYGFGGIESWTPAEKRCAFSLTRTGSMPKKGSEAEPGFWGHTPGRGAIMWAPVSVCHQVSLIGQRSSPTFCSTMRCGQSLSSSQAWYTTPQWPMMWVNDGVRFHLMNGAEDQRGAPEEPGLQSPCGTSARPQG